MQKQTNGIRIVHTSNLAEAERLTKEGWEPIECSIDGQSVVGRLQMDHHGKLSHLEGVAIRAYRDHFGACADGKVQGFVVTGEADADATFAIAALAGMLPHPSRAGEFEKTPWLKEAMTADFTTLAQIVNKVDVNPIDFVAQLPGMYTGRLLLAWQAFKFEVSDRSAFHAGVDRWRRLTGPRAPLHMIVAAGLEEQERIRRARLIPRISSMGKVSLIECSDWGFDVWYADYSPCVVWMKPDGSIDIGCKDEETSVRLFGEGGLMRLWAELDRATVKGWGGRGTIGGSPRGVQMTWGHGVEAALLLQKWIGEVEHTR